MEGKKVIAEERYNLIVRQIAVNGSISIAEIAQRFGVTPETARKDLMLLEKRGLVRRFHGGARLANENQDGLLLQTRMEENTQNKRKIAIAAAQLVEKGNTVILDSGSTSYIISEMLISTEDIYVISNSIPVVTQMVNNSVKALMIGGEVFQSDLSTAGDWVNYCLQNIYADIAFIGATGFNSGTGPTVENFVAAGTKKAMIEHAKKKYIVADSSKINASSLIQFIKWDDIDGIIIDNEADEEFIAGMKLRTNVIIAD